MGQLLEKALAAGASDVHLNSTSTGCSIYFRVHGVLSQALSYDAKLFEGLRALIKLHAHFDVSVETQPQDGRMSYLYQGKRYDIRLSSLPTVFGEDFVFRFFQTQSNQIGLTELGFSKTASSLIQSMLNLDSGLILVTGPTGSGKTTTLYSLLTSLAQQKKINIVSLEDPVESILEGVRQSQINTAIGYTFAKGLRAVLRQDPDCIMLGEIRDQETAQIALEAAYTGHLVLATLHTSDCKSSLLRLAGFGLDPFLVGYALKGIISQKLVLKSGSQGRMVWSEVMRVNTPFAGNPFQEVDRFMSENDLDSFAQDWKLKLAEGVVVETR